METKFIERFDNKRNEIKEYLAFLLDTCKFVIPADAYQPYDYWYVRIFYGSCSVCDTLQGVLYDSDDRRQQLDGLFTLALHIFQGLKKMD
mgnify:CR=1 FL=1